MKRLVARDTINNRNVTLSVRKGKLLVERYKGKAEPKYVLTNSHHDSHTHPTMYPLFFGALNPVMLNESTDKEEILSKLREKAAEGGPIVAYEYKLNAGITSEDLAEFKGYVWLVDSSLHSGVANNKLLDEMFRRKTGMLFGSATSKGITEDYNFLAMGIMEDMVQDKGVSEVVKWVKARIAEGTTSMDEKIIFTQTGWEIFKKAMDRLEKELGYMPVKSVYISHSVFIKNPRKYATEAESMGIDVGVKWVGDGGLGSKTAALNIWSYKDGSKGDLTIPITYQDKEIVDTYARLLLESGMTKLTCHAIGDKTIGIILGMAQQIQDMGLQLSMEHFELPTRAQIDRAASLGIPLSMQLNYSTEVWRYEPWVGNVVEHINPVRRTLNAYNMRGHGDLITFGTDGMPQSMLWAIACGVLHPVKHHRIKLEEAIRHSRDPEGLLVLTSGTYENLRTMNLKKATENREASAAELHNGVVLVARGSKVLHSTL